MHLNVVWCSGGCSWKCYKTLTFCSLLTTPLWREAHFQVKMHKTHHHAQTTFGSWKSARRCGAKHISKSKFTKHTIVGPLLEVEMSKKCTPLWREVHFEIKILKTPGFGPLLEVQMSLRVAGARDCAPRHFIRRIACHIRLELFLGALLLFNVVPRTIREIWYIRAGLGWGAVHHLLLDWRTFFERVRHLFRHLNFQKWSDAGVFCTCWLRNVLRATMACNFSSLIWPAGSSPAALASLLFDPPEPQIIGKTLCFATFLPFRASASAFFWLFLFFDLLSSTLLFSLPLPSSAFHLSILSEVWLLNFLRLNTPLSW